jgi:hypothetical protein
MIEWQPGGGYTAARERFAAWPAAARADLGTWRTVSTGADGVCTFSAAVVDDFGALVPVRIIAMVRA